MAKRRKIPLTKIENAVSTDQRNMLRVDGRDKGIQAVARSGRGPRGDGHGRNHSCGAGTSRSRLHADSAGRMIEQKFAEQHMKVRAEDLNSYQRVVSCLRRIF